MELVDVTDSKSVGGDIVWVRVPPPAPKLPQPLWGRGSFAVCGGVKYPLGSTPSRSEVCRSATARRAALSAKTSHHRQLAPCFARDLVALYSMRGGFHSLALPLLSQTTAPTSSPFRNAQGGRLSPPSLRSFSRCWKSEHLTLQRSALAASASLWAETSCQTPPLRFHPQSTLRAGCIPP